MYYGRKLPRAAAKSVVFSLKALSINRQMGKLACTDDCISDNLTDNEHIGSIEPDANFRVDCGNASA